MNHLEPSWPHRFAVGVQGESAWVYQTRASQKPSGLRARLLLADSPAPVLLASLKSQVAPERDTDFFGSILLRSSLDSHVDKHHRSATQLPASQRAKREATRHKGCMTQASCVHRPRLCHRLQVCVLGVPTACRRAIASCHCGRGSLRRERCLPLQRTHAVVDASPRAFRCVVGCTSPM